MKRNRESFEQEISEAPNSLPFFQKKKKIALKEEQYLINVYRKLYYNQLKEELGEEYTEEDVENAFQTLIEEKRANGTFQKILNKYLSEKIRREKAQFLTKSTAQNK